MKRLQIHPAAELLPAMTDADFAAMKQSIAADGQTDPIELFEGKILDGRHRYRACRELGIEPITREWRPNGTAATASPILHVYSRAVHRNLTDSQKAAAAVYIEAELAREAAARSAANLKRGTRHGTPATSGAGGAAAANGKSRDAAGRFFGVSGRYVQDAKLLYQQDRKLFEQVFNRALTLPAAKAAYRRAHKARHLASKAAEHNGKADWEIRCADCIDGLQSLPRKSVRLIVADPPYNIGVNYGRGIKADKLPADKYLAWCYAWMEECVPALTADGAMFVIINDEWADEFGVMLRRAGLVRRQWLKWYERFGVNNGAGFNRTSRHIFWMVKRADDFVFHRDAVTRPSDRQAKYGDKRAAAGGKTWDDVWGINPAIPRLVDNARERVPGFPTQLPLALVRPIVACASDPGDLVVDPFNGSGTTGEAAILQGRKYLGFDSNDKYVKWARQRLSACGVEPRRHEGTKGN